MATALFLTAAAAIGTYAWQSGAIGTKAAQEEMTADDAVLAAGYTDKDKAAIEAIVREYILSHPEIIPQAIQELQARRAAQKVDSVRMQIQTPYARAYAGNPDGKVVLVEFSDFACGFCRQSVGDVEQLIANNPDLKVVFREMPILSDESNTAAAWGMAAAQQGKYLAFYKAMFAAGRPSATTIASAARQAGLDMTSAQAFVNSGAAQDEVNANIGVAQHLEFTGTPSWVVGNRILSGAVGLEELQEAVDEARAENL